MGVAKNLMKKITSFSRKTATKARDWGRYLMVSVALAGIPASTGCNGPEPKLQEKEPIEETDIWAEPYKGDVVQDEKENFYMQERIIINFDKKTEVSFVEELTKKFEGRVTGQIPQINSFEVEVLDVDIAIQSLVSDPKVASVSRNYFFEAAWDNEQYSKQNSDKYDST
jgi:hypothetical protein